MTKCDAEWNSLRKIVANAMKKGLIAWNKHGVVLLVTHPTQKKTSKLAKVSSGKKNKLGYVKTAIGKK